MDLFASALIDALGGTAKVASLAEAPMSTVHNMRRRLTRSRLNHLRRIAAAEGLSREVIDLARAHGVALEPLAVGESKVEHGAEKCHDEGETSCGKNSEISARVPA